MASPERGRSPARRPFGGNAKRKKLNSLVSPDRFVPKREFGDTISTTFRVNKHPQELSPDEKLLRRRLPGDDPFLPTSHRPLGLPGQRPPLTRLRQRLHLRPRLVTDPAIIRGSASNESSRQVSAGAVWGVGGTSAVLQGSSAGVSNDAQSNGNRGSTAPVFVANFLPKRTKVDDRKKHEARVALALDIDQTTRLLSTCATCVETPPSPTSPHYEKVAPIMWENNAWKRVGREQCKWISISFPTWCFLREDLSRIEGDHPYFHQRATPTICETI